MKVVGQLGNPFVATSLELVALDAQNVMEESVVASTYEIREVGQTLHAAYTRERLEDSSVPDIIKRNNMLTFANRPESDLVNTSTTLNDTKQLPQQLFVIAGSISVRHVCCIEIQMFQKICIICSFLARAVDQLDR